MGRPWKFKISEVDAWQNQAGLALQGIPKEYSFPDILSASAYNQCGSTVLFR